MRATSGSVVVNTAAVNDIALGRISDASGGRVLADWPGLAAGQLYEGRDLRPTHAIDGLIASDVTFDAVFAANDMMAIGALQALTGTGLRVPEDVAVAVPVWPRTVAAPKAIVIASSGARSFM